MQRVRMVCSPLNSSVRTLRCTCNLASVGHCLYVMTVHKVTGIDGPGYADYLTSKGGAGALG